MAKKIYDSLRILGNGVDEILLLKGSDDITKIVVTDSGNIGIGTSSPDASSILDATSTSQGILTPRMDESQRDAITTPATGLLIYNTDTNLFNYYDGTSWVSIDSPEGNDWSNGGNSFGGLGTLATIDAYPIQFRAGVSSPIINFGDGMRLTTQGNLGIGNSNSFSNEARLHIIGRGTTSSFYALMVKDSVFTEIFSVHNSGHIKAGSLSTGNLFLGLSSGLLNTSGIGNTSFGVSSLVSNTSGGQNTAIGHTALNANTTGSFNTAIGDQAMNGTTTGNNNVAVGSNAFLNGNGDGNVAIGVAAMQVTGNSGSDNVAIGLGAAGSSTTASSNIAIGKSALNLNQTGTPNIAIGQNSMFRNTSGVNNTAVGHLSLQTNTSGNNNIAFGREAIGGLSVSSTALLVGTEYMITSVGSTNWTLVGGTNSINTIFVATGTTTGSGTARATNRGTSNIAIGTRASRRNTIANNNIAIGTDALTLNTTAGKNIAIGLSALTTQSFYNAGVAWDSKNIAIGDRALRLNQPTSISDGINNIAIGVDSLGINTTGFNSTAIGTSSLFSNITGSGNVSIGSFSGYYETGSNTLYIHNSLNGGSITDQATGKAQSLIYGEFNTTPTSQLFRINAVTQINDGSQAAGYVFVSDVNGVGTWTDPATIGADIPDITLNYIPQGTGTSITDGNWYFSGDDIVPLISGSNIGSDASPDQRIGTIYMSSNIDYLSTLSLKENGTTKVHIASGGNVGIGTTNVSAKLHIKGSGNTTSTSSLLAFNSDSAELFRIYDTGHINAGTVTGANLFFGYNSGLSITTGTGAVGIGYTALRDITTALSATAVGTNALQKLTTGNYNNAFGRDALGKLVTGSGNNAFGYFALGNSATGLDNSAFGNEVLINNSSGGSNSGFGAGALYSNTTASNITGIGAGAGYTNTGERNTYLGAGAGYYNTTGTNNIRIGANSGWRQTTLGYSLFIDNIDRGSAGAELTDSLVYGTFDAVPANQRFQINGRIKITQGSPGVGKVLTDSDGTGLATWTAPAGSVNKYAETLSYSPFIPADTPITITHSLGTTDIIIQLWDLSDGSLITAKVDNRTSSTVDVTFEGSSPAGDVRIVIMA